MQPEGRSELRKSELRSPRLPLTFDRLRLFVPGLLTGPTKLPRHATYTLPTQVETDHPHIRNNQRTRRVYGFVMKKNVIIITYFPRIGKFLLPSGFLHPAAQIALEIFLLDRLALVVKLLARAQGHLDLDKTAIVEIDPGRDQNQAALSRVTEDLLDLLLMEQEPPRPLGLLIKVTGLPIRLNLQVVEE